MTYAGVSAIFVAGALLPALAALVLRRGDRTWWLATAGTAVALFVLTVVFDSVMIAADLFRYDEDTLSGLRLLLAPVEDLAWPLAAVLGLPALWLLLGRHER